MIIRLCRWKLVIAFISFIISLFLCVFIINTAFAEDKTKTEYIKWAEMNFSLPALRDTMELDIETYDMLYHISWIDSLSYLACQNGNSWKSYKKSDLDKMKEKLGELYTVDDLMSGNKYYSYYKEVFSAMLGGILGEYEESYKDEKGNEKTRLSYGMIAYNPIADGFYYSHYDDFGVSRSYGYRRQHLGNDLMGYVGIPVVSVEKGRVENIGWNKYGGWRLGIRSVDGKRSYYYVHLRKGRPYAEGIELGTKVEAGQVIGYLGMTGYSDKADVNGMTSPHLHFGMQLIFDESQKEGTNQIWLDVYNLVKLLYSNRAVVVKDGKTGEYRKVR